MGGLSLPGGRALGCASSRSGVGAAAQTSCEEIVGRCCRVVTSAGGYSGEEEGE